MKRDLLQTEGKHSQLHHMSGSKIQRSKRHVQNTEKQNTGHNSRCLRLYNSGSTLGAYELLLQSKLLFHSYPPFPRCWTLHWRHNFTCIRLLYNLCRWRRDGYKLLWACFLGYKLLLSRSFMLIWKPFFSCVFPRPPFPVMILVRSTILRLAKH